MKKVNEYVLLKRYKECCLFDFATLTVYCSCNVRKENLESLMYYDILLDKTQYYKVILLTVSSLFTNYTEITCSRFVKKLNICVC